MQNLFHTVLVLVLIYWLIYDIYAAENHKIQSKNITASDEEEDQTVGSQSSKTKTSRHEYLSDSSKEDNGKIKYGKKSGFRPNSNQSQEDFSALDVQKLFQTFLQWLRKVESKEHIANSMDHTREQSREFIPQNDEFNRRDAEEIANGNITKAQSASTQQNQLNNQYISQDSKFVKLNSYNKSFNPFVEASDKRKAVHVVTAHDLPMSTIWNDSRVVENNGTEDTRNSGMESDVPGTFDDDYRSADEMYSIETKMTTRKSKYIYYYTTGQPKIKVQHPKVHRSNFEIQNTTHLNEKSHWIKPLMQPKTTLEMEEFDSSEVKSSEEDGDSGSAWKKDMNADPANVVEDEVDYTDLCEDEEENVVSESGPAKGNGEHNEGTRRNSSKFRPVNYDPNNTSLGENDLSEYNNSDRGRELQFKERFSSPDNSKYGRYLMEPTKNSLLDDEDLPTKNSTEEAGSFRDKSDTKLFNENDSEEIEENNVLSFKDPKHSRRRDYIPEPNTEISVDPKKSSNFETVVNSTRPIKISNNGEQVKTTKDKPKYTEYVTKAFDPITDEIKPHTTIGPVNQFHDEDDCEEDELASDDSETKPHYDTFTRKPESGNTASKASKPVKVVKTKPYSVPNRKNTFQFKKFKPESINGTGGLKNKYKPVVDPVNQPPPADSQSDNSTAVSRSKYLPAHNFPTQAHYTGNPPDSSDIKKLGKYQQSCQNSVAGPYPESIKRIQAAKPENQARFNYLLDYIYSLSNNSFITNLKQERNSHINTF